MKVLFVSCGRVKRKGVMVLFEGGGEYGCWLMKQWFRGGELKWICCKKGRLCGGDLRRKFPEVESEKKMRLKEKNCR